jgi:hypothetical protein
MMDDKIIKNNCNKMVKERKERLAERLLQLRSNIILQHYNFTKEKSKSINKIYKNNYFYTEVNSINKKKEFKTFINQDNNGDIPYINNINNYEHLNNNKGLFYRKKNDSIYNKTMGPFYQHNNNISQTILNNEKNNKINELNIQNDFNKSKTKLNYKNKTKPSIKNLNIQETFSMNTNIKLNEEDNKLNDNNIKININKFQNEGIIKEISKYSNSVNKNDTQRSSLITSRYPEKNSKDSKIDKTEKMKKLSKTKRTKSINNLNNLEDFINFGNLKLHKLLLKQSMVYNTEIDKIDKIIINNYDKVTPLSYKILINKEKTKKKMLEEINKFPNLKKKQIEQRNNNNYIPLKYKENQFKS